MATDTVEWGREDGRAGGRRGLTLSTPPRNPRAVTGGLAVLGFVLVLVGEVLPWLELKPTGDAGERGEFPANLDASMRLADVALWQTPAYYIGLTALLALAALALAGRPRARLGAATAAVGVAAGQTALLAGLHASIQDGGQVTGLFGRMPEGIAEFSVGDGFYSATVGILLVAGAAALAARWSAAPTRPTAADAGNGPRDPAEVAPAEWADQPADLTVAPAAPFQVPPPARSL
jgi:hypothetical protein